MRGKVLLLTVGIGRSSEQAMTFAIRQSNPDFVLFIATNASASIKVPLVLAQVGSLKYGVKILEDENDLRAIYRQCTQWLQKLIEDGFNPKDIVADFTSGTKAMAAGLVLACVRCRIGALHYVWGNRDNEGRVISGTERLAEIEVGELLG